jgi:hypothetical protein
MNTAATYSYRETALIVLSTFFSIYSIHEMNLFLRKKYQKWYLYSFSKSYVHISKRYMNTAVNYSCSVDERMN